MDVEWPKSQMSCIKLSLFEFQLIDFFLYLHLGILKKNTPNDLQMLSDAPAHHLFALLGPLSTKGETTHEVLCVLQVCLEGGISSAAVMQELARGKGASGDLIPWTLNQQFLNDDFPKLSGARIIRIATHTSYQGVSWIHSLL